MIIAIDGPAGTGKGTISKLISERLGFTYIETGAMYRAVALKMIRENISVDNMAEVIRITNEIKIDFINEDGVQKTYMDGEDVSDAIRTANVTSIVAKVSSIREVREKLVSIQRQMAEGKNVVMEGRDITTVVFPNAEVKIYMTADAEERAQRRYDELITKGVNTTYDEVFKSIVERDEIDMNKPYGALMIADDAQVVDTTATPIEDVYKKVESIILSKF